MPDDEHAKDDQTADAGEARAPSTEDPNESTAGLLDAVNANKSESRSAIQALWTARAWENAELART